MATIFKITSPEDRIYIGRSVNFNHRMKALRYNKTIKKHKSLTESFNKYGFDNHKIEIIEVCDESKMRDKHKFWIDFYKSNKIKFIDEKGLNENIGGGGSGSCSEQRKIKIGKANLGKKRTPEQRSLMKEIAIKNQRKRILSKEEIDELIKEYQDTNVMICELRSKYGISARYINEIFEDNNIKKQHRVRDNITRIKVINIKTNVIYPTIKKAADSINMSPSVLRRRLLNQIKNKTDLKFC